MKHDEIECREQHWRRQPWIRRGYFRGPAALVGIILALWFCYQLKLLIISLVFALTLASAISPVAEWCETKWKVSRTLTVIFVYALVALLYSFLVAALFPTLKEQALSLYERFPDYADSLNNFYNHMRELLGENVANFSITSSEVKTFVSKGASHALDITSDLATLLVTGILVAFLTAYFVVSANEMWPKILDWFPLDSRARAAGLIRPLESRLGGYVRGQLLVSVAVSTFLTIGLSILQVEHALLLGALSGLLNLVPFVGSMITAVLAILVAFNQSPMLALATAGLFALEQWFESNIIVPNLLGKQVELHPLIVLFAILIGATTLGVAGALIAVPVATAGMFLAEEFYLRPLHERERQEQQDTTSNHDAEQAQKDESFANAAAILSETRPSKEETTSEETISMPEKKVSKKSKKAKESEETGESKTEP